MPPDTLAKMAQSGLELDPLLWDRRAGDIGMVQAKCSHGLAVFRRADILANPDLSRIETHFRAGPTILGTPPEVLGRAVSDLKTPAETIRLPRRETLPFGSPAL